MFIIPAVVLKHDEGFSRPATVPMYYVYLGCFINVLTWIQSALFSQKKSFCFSIHNTYLCLLFVPTEARRHNILCFQKKHHENIRTSATTVISHIQNSFTLNKNAYNYKN